MVVYADILIILNIIVDWFLLSAASRIIKQKVSPGRMLAASVAGGIASLYIFVPFDYFLLGIIVRAAVCTTMTLIAFGFGKPKWFLRRAGILFIVTCAYGGLMIAVWYIFKPRGMVVNNSVVYFNISPVVLIGISVITYILFMLLSGIFERTSKSAKKCDITVTAFGSSIDIKGIIDTGNSLEDFLGGSEVIIADKTCAEKLFGSTDTEKNEKLKTRFRLMPCGTVSGGGTLDGFRCDTAVVSDGESSVKIEKPILAVSKTPIRDDYSAIVNPRIFM